MLDKHNMIKKYLAWSENRANFPEKCDHLWNMIKNHIINPIGFSRISLPSLRIGTPHYMAPEVMRGHGYGTEAVGVAVLLFFFASKGG